MVFTTFLAVVENICVQLLSANTAKSWHSFMLEYFLVLLIHWDAESIVTLNNMWRFYTLLLPFAVSETFDLYVWIVGLLLIPPCNFPAGSRPSLTRACGQLQLGSSWASWRGCSWGGSAAGARSPSCRAAATTRPSPAAASARCSPGAAARTPRTRLPRPRRRRRTRWRPWAASRRSTRATWARTTARVPARG